MGTPVTLVGPGAGNSVDVPIGTTANPLQTTTNSLQVTSDLTQQIVNTAVSGDNTIITATAAQTTRVYRMRLNVAGAVIVTIKSAATVMEVIKFPAAGILTYDFATRPWYKTAVNSAFIISLSAAVQTDGVIEYVKS